MRSLGFGGGRKWERAVSWEEVLINRCSVHKGEGGDSSINSGSAPVWKKADKILNKKVWAMGLSKRV